MNLLLAATLLLASASAPNANAVEMRVPVPGLRGVETANVLMLRTVQLPLALVANSKTLC